MLKNYKDNLFIPVNYVNNDIKISTEITREHKFTFIRVNFPYKWIKMQIDLNLTQLDRLRYVSIDVVIIPFDITSKSVCFEYLMWSDFIKKSLKAKRKVQRNPNQRKINVSLSPMIIKIIHLLEDYSTGVLSQWR